MHRPLKVFSEASPSLAIAEINDVDETATAATTMMVYRSSILGGGSMYNTKELRLQEGAETSDGRLSHRCGTK